MKFVHFFLVCVITITSSGCATQQGNNILTGVGGGALFGAAVGDTTNAAKRGAVLGGILGALTPINQSQLIIQQPGVQVPIVQQPGVQGQIQTNSGSLSLLPIPQNFQRFPAPQKGMCDNPYQVNRQGQPMFSGRYPC